MKDLHTVYCHVPEKKKLDLTVRYALLSIQDVNFLNLQLSLDSCTLLTLMHSFQQYQSRYFCCPQQPVEINFEVVVLHLHHIYHIKGP